MNFNTFPSIVQSLGELDPRPCETLTCTIAIRCRNLQLRRVLLQAAEDQQRLHLARVTVSAGEYMEV